MVARIDIGDLISEVDELHDQFPNLTKDNAFVLWFLQAHLLDDAELASRHVTGASHDKGIDAIYIDETLKRAFLVQGKLHKSERPPTESRMDVMGFASIARKITASDEEFRTFEKKLNATVAKGLRDVRERVKKRGFELSLYYVTTGKCSTRLETEAQTEAARANARTTMTVLGRSKVLTLLIDYIGGAAPAVPFLDLTVDTQGVIGSNSMIHRIDPRSGIGSWIMTMSGKQVGDLYKKAGDRLFARNIRGFMGDGKKSINSGIKTTLTKEPENFWYFNNGVTIVCNSAKRISQRTPTTLRVINPQIINGQQTTRVLSENGTKKSTVIVRVISVPRELHEHHTDFERLVSDIVAATNSQNAILRSDLRSNDERQVSLQKKFAKLKYNYIRKRQSKSEAKRIFGTQFRAFIKMDDLAQVIGACELDPYITRSGKQGLFESPYYDEIFDDRSVEEYLSIYLLNSVIKKMGSRRPDRAYAKWYALNFLWRSTAPFLRGHRGASEFRRQAERKKLDPAIEKAADVVYRSLQSFFREHRGTGEGATDISNFFYKPHQDRLFVEFWLTSTNKRRRLQFDRHIQLFRQSLNLVS